MTDFEFTLTSTEFNDGDTLPKKFTCDGRDISPPLDWFHYPQETRSFVLIYEDQDAPGGTFDHWVVWNIPATSGGILEDVPPADHLPHDTKQGQNSFGRVGYNGPCPSGGKKHRYVFTVYALDAQLELAPGSIKRQVVKAAKQHILAQASLSVTYGH